MTRFLSALALALVPLAASADDHAAACCRDMAHTLELRPCVVCGKEGADCRTCKACAKARGECSHCRAADGFSSLFNGKDLAGWTVMGEKTWEVRDGVIACKGGADHGGWLRTIQEYDDFVWRFEFRFPEGKGNSGAFLRATEQGNPAFTGMEVQLLADAGQPPSKGSCGALYGSLTPSKTATRPGAGWNDMEITCRGRALKIVLNGETIADVPNLDDPAIPFQEKKLADRAKKGFLGLQDHKSRVEFRNLRANPAPGESPRSRAAREHGIRIPLSARNIQCRGDAGGAAPDRGAATLFEMDKSELAEFERQLGIQSRTLAVKAGPGDPCVNGYNVWPSSSRTFVPGNAQYGGFTKTWTGSAVPVEMKSCTSPVGDWLHVEVWEIEDRLLIKLYTDWN